MDEIETNVAMSHKGKRILSCSLNYKLEAIGCSKSNSNSSASKEFNVDKKSIREWRKSKDKFLSLRKKHRGAKSKRLNGAGCKPIDQQMKVPVEWIYNWREKGLRVSQKFII